MPRVFSDIYSFASAHFETGSEPTSGAASTSGMQTGGIRGGFAKGVIGWTSDMSLIVVGAGRDGRWERYVIGETENGERYCAQDGWRSYLGGG